MSQQDPLGRRAPEARRRRVLDEARKLLIAHGPHGLRVEEVAAKAGVSVGLIYRQHATKAHLVAAVRDDFEDRFIGALTLLPLEGLSPAARFRPVLEALFDVAAAEPDLTGMLSMPGPEPAPPRLHAWIVGMVADGVSSGAFRDVPVEPAAVVAYGMVEAAMRQCFGLEQGRSRGRYVEMLADAWSCWLLR